MSRMDEFRSEQELSELKDKKFKEIRMDTYLNEPYMLLSRVIDRNVRCSLQGGRIIFRKNDDTVIMNIPLDNTKNCKTRRFSNSYYQVLFNIHNIQYKVLAMI